MGRVQVRGHPRSGTTAMAQLLRIPGEIFITHELGLYQPEGDTIREIVDSFKSGVVHGAPNNTQLYDVATTINFLNTLYDQTSYEGILTAFEEKLFAGYEHFGDKFPHPITFPVLPGTKIIYMIRDGRNVVASRLRAMQIPEEDRPDWATTDVKTAASEWASTLKTWRQKFRLAQHFAHEVKLEDLIYNRKETCAGLAHFLDISEDKLLRRIDETITVEDARLYAWETELPDWEKQFPGKAMKTLERYGYINDK